ncbi:MULTISPECIES: flavin reductase family protein [Sphingomonadaceae]|uniref:flavin reductase family protein n=1 Tax=Sphingomonadales TaxID=204457 RepID=UPI0018D3FBD5|nr:flavin reductase family protein [Sphingobium sp. TKS]MCF8706665.1 flavin reductase family protein [Rhizorhapis sp. SPR117]
MRGPDDRGPMRPFPLSEVYRLLEPGPVVLLTTAHQGRSNVMTMSWHMMVEFTPPLIACTVSDADFSFVALRATSECVIAVPAMELASKVVEIGNCSGRDVDKFAATGLTQLPAAAVTAPLVAECFANLECRVVETSLVGKYNLFVLEVVAAWHDPARDNSRTIHHRGHGTFIVDGETILLPSRMP